MKKHMIGCKQITSSQSNNFQRNWWRHNIIILAATQCLWTNNQLLVMMRTFSTSPASVRNPFNRMNKTAPFNGDHALLHHFCQKSMILDHYLHKQ